MEYKIVHGDDKDELTIRVNEAIDEGWVPQGGVVVLINTFSKNHFQEGATEVWEPWSDEWHQAMIKTEPVNVKINRVTRSQKTDPELGW